jgi:hypothetical protein
MSSPESINSTGSEDSNSSIPEHTRRNPTRRRQSGSLSASQRPLPNLPQSRPTSGPGPASNVQRAQNLATLLRNRPLPLSPSASEQTPEEQRQSIIALDRKRRLTSTSSHEESRRRTNSGGWNNRPLPTGASSRRPSNSNAAMQRPLAEIIDLTGSSPPPTPQRETTSPRRVARNPSYVLPPWQPDAEVTECPICRRAFTFMFRRHHCRKCGRVVCNDCSPHRIIIPRQFIVHPPGLEEFASSRDSTTRRSNSGGSSDAGTDDDVQGATRPKVPVLEGGERVRLCNPCVPDPQPDPFPNPPRTGAQSSQEPQWSMPPRPNVGMGLPPTPDGRSRGYSAGVGGHLRNAMLASQSPLHGHHRSISGLPSSLADQSSSGHGMPLFGSYGGQPAPFRYRLPTSASAQPRPFGLTMVSQACNVSLRDEPLTWRSRICWPKIRANLTLTNGTHSRGHKHEMKCTAFQGNWADHILVHSTSLRIAPQFVAHVYMKKTDAQCAAMLYRLVVQMVTSLPESLTLWSVSMLETLRSMHKQAMRLQHFELPKMAQMAPTGRRRTLTELAMHFTCFPLPQPKRTALRRKTGKPKSALSAWSNTTSERSWYDWSVYASSIVLVS